MNAPTDWITAIAILAAGLILGVIFVLVTKRRNAPVIHDDLALKDLRAKRDALVLQLRDPGLTPDERTRLELETADVLRKLDATRGATTISGAPATMTTAGTIDSLSMNPTAKGFLWGAGSVAALALLGWLVMEQAKPRVEGGSLTGDIPQPQAAQRPAADPAVMQLEAAVQKDPNNLQLRNDLAQAYLERENLMGVFEQTKFVLDRKPDDSRALTFQGLVRMAMGEVDEAATMLQKAAQIDPKNLDTWVSLAWLYAQQDRMADAEKMMSEAKKHAPQQEGRLDQVFAQMKQHVAQAKAAPQDAMGGAGLPAGHPPVDGAPAAAAPMGRVAGPSVKVTLNLDPAARAKQGIVFVMARNPAGGPPIAAKRLQVTSFPITFDFGAADSMMGQPLPETFRLEARLDSDGDAATKTPNDPTAMQEGVVAGTQVNLALK